MNKTVFITGGTRGIGRAIVEKFARENYKVAFVYAERDDAAEEVFRKTNALPIKCDVRDSKGIKEAIKRAKDYFKVDSFDVLVCNAGISTAGLVTELTDEENEATMDVNFGGVLNTIRAELPAMVSQKKGAIVNISSMWGLAGASCESVYAASKAAVIGLTKSIAREVGPSGIRVNAIAPGVIMTDMCSSITDDVMNKLKDETPLMRIGEPEDVAEAVFFLASDKASFITGQVLGVDGGYIV